MNEFAHFADVDQQSKRLHHCASSSNAIFLLAVLCTCTVIKGECMHCVWMYNISYYIYGP